MRSAWVYLILLYVALCYVYSVGAAKAKKHNQELKHRASAQTTTAKASKTPNKAPNTDPNSNPSTAATPEPISDEEDYLDEAKDENTCPPCAVSKHLTKFAINRYWNHDIDLAYACACQALLVTPTDNLAKALLLSLHTSRLYPLPSTPPSPSAPTSTVISDWEVLGPINVGMLELDGDPTFDYVGYKKAGFDIASYLLSLPSDNPTSASYTNATVLFSDLSAGGRLEWVKVRGGAGGQVDLHYSLAWNELAQGVSNSGAVYEFTAWGRAVSYLTKPGTYTLQCLGVHSAYIRNNNLTHVLVGDVYGGHAAPVMTSVELREGLVGVVMVVRASIQRSVRCELKSSSDSLVVFTPEYVSDIMEVKEEASGTGGENKKGVLLSPYFSLPIFNPFAQPVVPTFQLEKLPGGLEGWGVREVGEGGGGEYKHTPVAPGQTLAYSLELIPPSSQGNPTTSSSSALPYPLLPCREKLSFTVLITASKGKGSRVRVDVKCRPPTNPLSLSYLSPDMSVTPLALSLPLDFHSPHLVEKVREVGKTTGDKGSNSKDSNKKASRSKYPKNTQMNPSTPIFPPLTSLTLQQTGYPALVTLHGSGIAPLQHAEAYKVMPKDSNGAYVFGVVGYYVLAPGRFGAHNWEGVGGESVESAIVAVQKVTAMYPTYLPPISLQGGILSGHSMGGHGAWIGGVSNPHLYTCLSPIGGWVKKPEYSHGNAFFDLDVSSSYTPAQHKAILAKAWGEYDVDQMVAGGEEGVKGGLGSMRVHIRVGSHDLTTHPWFSRRMYRLLVRSAGRSEELVSYEEVGGKGHWWWDTSVDNDGGVVNDYRMREFYHECLDRYIQQVAGNGTSISSKLISSVVGNDDLSSEAATSSSSSANTSVSSPPTASNTFNPCPSPLTVTSINPATQRGHCGIQVLHQHIMLATSRVVVDSSGDRCNVATANVKELLMVLSPAEHSHPQTPHQRAVCRANQSIYVNKQLHVGMFSSPNSWQFLRLCMSSTKVLQPCAEHAQNHFLNYKTLISYGPIRHIYHRPLIIIYGTPTQQTLRIYIKELAVYLANAIYIAHKTHVSVYSDLEARAQPQYFFKAPLQNVIFIGDSSQNKVLKGMTHVDGNPKPSSVGKGGGYIPWEYRFPEGLQMHGYQDSGETESEYEADEEVGLDGVGTLESKKVGFSVGGRNFPSAQHGVMFTFPFQTPSAPNPTYPLGKIHSLFDIGHHAMGICIHANTVQGYMHLTRLAWPVIPPMVRPPFAAYLPDYVVVGEGVWEKGTGGVLGMGFWDAQWKYDELQASWLSEYL